LIAAMLGGAIGFEREHRGKAAGMRTHMLVALGAALFVLVVQQSGGGIDQVSRVIQGLVAGIGFLGAGTIMQYRREEDVKGLTTATSIWLTAAIGTTAGMGRMSTALLTTIVALVILAAMPHFVHKVLPPRGPKPNHPTVPHAPTAPGAES
jgi:putative Mg2+ transporter-C (MgtC) family protein